MAAKETLQKNAELEEAKNPVAAVVSEYLKQMENFEADRVQLVKDQLKFSKKVSVAFCVFAILAIGAVVSLAPMKTIEPYVIRVDNNTGFTDVVAPMSDKAETYEEKINRFWLGQFVHYREGYYWNTVEDSYNKVSLMSDDKVFSQYQTFIFSNASPVKVHAEDKSIKVDIQGITFLDTPTGQVAQVRLTKTVQDKNGANSTLYPVSSWLATITFDYEKEIKTKGDEQINPLGFRVVSYRIDAINS